MANTFKFGAGKWAAKEGSVLAYNDENNNFKPLPFTFTRASTATRVNESGLIESVASGVPRIDYLDNADGHLLLEPSRTNLITYSEQLNLWSGANVTTTANTSESPDGYQNADNVNITATDGYWKIGSLTFANSTSYSASVFVKKSATTGTKTFRLYYNNNTGSPNNGEWRCVIDLTNITATTTALGTAVTGAPTILNTNLVDYGNDWYRVEVSFTTGSGAGNSISEIGFTANGVVVDFDSYGAQLELGSYATSYIPTSGSSVTRAADTCSGAGNTQVFGNSEGVLYAELKALFNGGDTRTFSISNGTNSNTVYINVSPTANTIGAQVIVGGVAQCNLNASPISQTNLNKVAIKYKANDFALWINGVKVATDTSGVTFSSGTLDRFNFNFGQGSFPLVGEIKDVKIYNQALSDSQLAALTS